MTQGASIFPRAGSGGIATSDPGEFGLAEGEGVLAAER